MAELHILGHINCAQHFTEGYSLYCRYTVQAGPNWTLLSGSTEGQTSTGWPKLVFHVNCLDSLERSWVVGYGCTSLPTVPGYHTIRVPCWLPAATSISDSLRQYFLGGSHQITQNDIISLGNDRFKLRTQSKGCIEINICIILRNFTQFGVEYK
ncbi:B9 domain-containing protein 2-like isoform X3 [Pieris brassicae]|uniref:B9 domain-containing protein 2-like isoform X3 n=1 Tax=Pieris brassicae TaxID=7116 RepID=UPI001E65EDFA|nr:B9 domain-containing protein 2-like isoform X3 [Pieris brassicae]